MTPRALPRGRSTLSPAHLFRIKDDAPSRQAPTDPHHRRSTGAQPGLHSTITHLSGVPSTIIFRPEFRHGEATRTPSLKRLPRALLWRLHLQLLLLNYTQRDNCD
jgi:hypothetical protein